jgi:hypothetical protein
MKIKGHFLPRLKSKDSASRRQSITRLDDASAIMATGATITCDALNSAGELGREKIQRLPIHPIRLSALSVRDGETQAIGAIENNFGRLPSPGTPVLFNRSNLSMLVWLMESPKCAIDLELSEGLSDQLPPPAWPPARHAHTHARAASCSICAPARATAPACQCVLTSLCHPTNGYLTSLERFDKRTLAE